MSRTSLVRRTLTALAALTVAGLALTACATGENVGDKPASGDLLASVDTNFGKIDIPKPKDGKQLRVVALGWSDGEVALSLGVKPVAIYDWQSFGEKNKGVGPWATAEFGKDTPVLIPRTDATLNYEQIQSLNPDVILNVRAALDEKVWQRLNEIAPTVSAVKGTPDYAVKWTDHTRMIAKVLGKEKEGETLIKGLEDKIATIRSEHPEFAGKTFTSGSKFGDAYGASLPGDARFDLYGDLGFVLNPAIKALPAQGFYAPVSVEQVPAMDADTAVLTTIGYPLQAIKDDALIQALPMVKDGRAIFADPEGIVMAGSSAGTIRALELTLDEVVPQLADSVAKLGK
ncbi:iron-siderophore ABC transporter substrate-binding protein [Mycetocola saprophilus]|uniref:iron-siderophore ABC transporter substrate-binding protein n=1 Tax=Mycetocola saprophilus TaxID=76636 RepID=UPI0004BE7385|nr:iron-siderophore ABC transporter substrate-binding protein [Mycetocola saprophilus]